MIKGPSNEHDDGHIDAEGVVSVPARPVPRAFELDSDFDPDSGATGLVEFPNAMQISSGAKLNSYMCKTHVSLEE